MTVYGGSVAVVVGVALSTVLWTGLWGGLRLADRQRSHAWHGRLVAAIHGGLISLLSLLAVIVSDNSPFDEPGAESSIYEELVQVLCLGYFLFDCVCCVLTKIYGSETLLFAFHHLVSMTGMVTSLYLGVSGTELCAAIFLAECTNPMFQLRWFMREAGLTKGDPRYELNDLAFLTSFMTLRGPVAQYLAYCVLMHARPTRAVKTLVVAFCVLNALLMFGMIEFMYRRYMAPLLGRVGGGGRPTAPHLNGASVGAEARLNNNVVSFEEISSHKVLWAKVQHLLYRGTILSKDIKQK